MKNFPFMLAPSFLGEKPLEPAVYIVPTPIGNLGDITLRALQTLASADLIACEDTRVTGKLLKHFALQAKLLSYHEHNAETQTAEIIAALESGKSIALISDAGTPLISDPGYRLVNEIIEADFPVIPLPGACAPITALSASGLPTDTFLFAGFLPNKSNARKTRLSKLANIPATLALFESPKRLAACLSDCAEILGPTRDVVIAREITKLYETFYRGPLHEIAENFQKVENLKGEIVLLIGPPTDQAIDEEDIDKQLKVLLKDHHVKEAVRIAAETTGQSKRTLYQRALELKEAIDNGP